VGGGAENQELPIDAILADFVVHGITSRLSRAQNTSQLLSSDSLYIDNRNESNSRRVHSLKTRPSFAAAGTAAKNT
jgi:hypothetical protein